MLGKWRALTGKLILIFATIIQQILVPYLRSKAQALYEQLGGGVDSDLFSDTPREQHAFLQESQRVSKIISQ